MLILLFLQIQILSALKSDPRGMEMQYLSSSSEDFNIVKIRPKGDGNCSAQPPKIPLWKLKSDPRGMEILVTAWSLKLVYLLKSDPRGMEIVYLQHTSGGMQLKSDPRGMEIIFLRSNFKRNSVLKSDPRGMEMQYVAIYFTC